MSDQLVNNNEVITNSLLSCNITRDVIYRTCHWIVLSKYCLSSAWQQIWTSCNDKFKVFRNNCKHCAVGLLEIFRRLFQTRQTVIELGFKTFLKVSCTNSKLTLSLKVQPITSISFRNRTRLAQVWVIVEGRGSEVEGLKSRVEGCMSRVESHSSRVRKSRSRVKSKGSEYKGLYAFLSF